VRRAETQVFALWQDAWVCPGSECGSKQVQQLCLLADRKSVLLSAEGNVLAVWRASQPLRKIPLSLMKLQHLSVHLKCVVSGWMLECGHGKASQMTSFARSRHEKPTSEQSQDIWLAHVPECGIERAPPQSALQTDHHIYSLVYDAGIVRQTAL
jgi:hypothetical protein